MAGNHLTLVKEGGSFDSTGGGGDDGNMDRIESLEKTVGRLETDIGSVKVDVAGMRNDLSEVRITLADLNSKLNIGEIRANVEKAHTDIYKWIATVAIPAASLAIAVYAGLKSSAPPQVAQPPVVITLPSTPAPSASPTAPAH